jgi:putative NADH-flavin reductase
MTRILVIGGSRGIGLAVCRIAAGRGHFVRAMSRDGRLPKDIGGTCEAFPGDARNVADVAHALEGIDVVVQALGVPQSLDFILKPVTLFSEATRVLLREMEQAGVRKLVAVTGFGAGDSRGAINILPAEARFQCDFQKCLRRQVDPGGTDRKKRSRVAGRATRRPHEWANEWQIHSSDPPQRMAQRDCRPRGRGRLHRQTD